MKLYHRILCLCLLLSPHLHAQQLFKGVLINALDSSTVSGAVVKLPQTGDVTTTGDRGEFHFTLRSSPGSVSFNISGIGFSEVVNLHKPFNTPQKIFITILPNELDNFTFVGLSAKDVVKKAVASIPTNYADSSYFAYSSYRQYEKVNGTFRNLVEAKPVVMFSLKRLGNEIVSTEAFAVSQLRTILYHNYLTDFSSDNPADLLMTNPVYHLMESSLASGMINNSTFSFDTVEKQKDYYVINYFSKHSMDDHSAVVTDLGVTKKAVSSWWLGESWEKGKITIDRNSFAIVRFERKSARYESYDYPHLNNFIVGHPEYFAKFVDGYLVVDYEQQQGKWYLKQLNRKYTHEFYSRLSSKREYTISSCFEWSADSISRYTSDEYVNKFYSKMQLTGLSYNSDFWQRNSFPFQLCNTTDVYNDLKQSGSLDDQFQWSVQEKKK